MDIQQVQSVIILSGSKINLSIEMCGQSINSKWKITWSDGQTISPVHNHQIGCHTKYAKNYIYKISVQQTKDALAAL